MTSLKGKLLIASPRLADPNFRRTVVLLVRDDTEEGSLGLVLNRPMTLSVKDACDGVLESECKLDEPLYQGGPCEGPLMVLYTGPGDADDRIADGVHFTTDRHEVERLLNDDLAGRRVKCFVGYSGWGEGQLAGEIDEGAWVSCPATSDLVFGDISREWSKLLTHLTYGPELPLDRIPEDPTAN